jgi:2-polyprenyl-6-hydroxyphenyl methylase/3-demethylubiquinone-9 3-methyltransferase
MAMKACEQLTKEQALDRLTETDVRVARVIARLEPLLPARHPVRVLEIGAAQGRGVISLLRMGFDAYGVEPWKEAIAVAEVLARHEGVPMRVREGAAEKIPFEAGSFELVLAFSVMEHVHDLDLSLREIARVLVPGGVFWFYSASAVCPWQNEIAGFPLFAWYPDRLKKYIMRWAARERPHLIGHTATPALHWWTPLRARRLLRGAGFDEFWERWDLCGQDELRGRAGAMRRLLRTYRWLRPLADVAIPDCAYAARKSVRGRLGGETFAVEQSTQSSRDRTPDGLPLAVRTSQAPRPFMNAANPSLHRSPV